MAKSLVIVESPTKARTIAQYLGPDFIVDLVVRLMAGEDVDVANEIARGQRITYRERCRQCLLDVVRGNGPLPTVEELNQIQEGRRTHRRERRARRRASL